MQFELRTQVVEPRRKTFSNLARRYGDRPTSRYEEGSVDIQATENFHYRPLWAPDKELYDPAYTAFRLTDPYSFLDPRQLYYAPYVQSRAASGEAFSKSLEYVDARQLLMRLPEGWQAIVADLLLPLRHYEAGAELISIEGSRFAYGTTIDQACTYAAFDRIGNAQSISRIGIAFNDGHAHVLAEAKEKWLADPALQGLRRLIEELLTERDYAKELLALDLSDRMIYAVMFTHLDEAALLSGAGAYSLMAQHFSTWFLDQRRWIDHLIKTWFADPEYADTNKAAFNDVLERRWSQIVEAVGDFAAALDSRVDTGAVAAAETAAAAVATQLGELGLTVPGGK
jgi:phenol/toluene 2-monooxygenase (NADH) P1/A1